MALPKQQPRHVNFDEETVLTGARVIGMPRFSLGGMLNLLRNADSAIVALLEDTSLVHRAKSASCRDCVSAFLVLYLEEGDVAPSCDDGEVVLALESGGHSPDSSGMTDKGHRPAVPNPPCDADPQSVDAGGSVKKAENC